MLNTGFSLPQIRVLYEIGWHQQNQKPFSGAQLSQLLKLDPGYISRILVKLEKHDLIVRGDKTGRGQRRSLGLTKVGQKLFVAMGHESSKQAADMLRPLNDHQRSDIVQAMARIQTLLGDVPVAQPELIIGPPQAGDFGWVVHRHGVIYTQEYGFNDRFEPLVAGIVAKFAAERDDRVERCWIARYNGRIVGSIFIMRQDETTAKLRLLYVEADARGLGVGKKLVKAAISFAKSAGYQRMTLWTNAALLAARGIYQREGFVCVSSEEHTMFGPTMIGETWELNFN